MTNSIGKTVAKGALWMVLFKVAERSIGLVSTVILARLLVPTDFGLVALATAIIALLEVFGSFSFDLVLIQKQQADRSYYDTAWTFNVIVGVAIGVVLLIVAIPAGSFYNDARLEAIVAVLALAPFLNGLENVGIVAFRKDLEFHKEFAFLIAKKFISFAVTVTLAVLLRSYWALIAGIVTSRLTGTVLSYWVHPYRPRLSLNKRRELFNFSSWLFFGNIIQFVNNRMSDFVVGKIAGSHALGLFSLAYEVSNLPTTELVAPINRAVFPGYARVGNDVAALRAGYLAVIGLITLLTVPLGLGIAATASVFVPFVLGPKWIEAVELINILAFFGMLHTLQGNTGSVYIALGRPKSNTVMVSIYAAMMVPLLILGTMKVGSTGAAYGLLVSVIAILPINMGHLFHLLKMKFRDFLRVVWRPAIAGSSMFAAVTYIKMYLAPQDSASAGFADLLILVASGAVVYTLAILLLWTAGGRPSGAEAAVLSHLRQWLLKRTGFSN